MIEAREEGPPEPSVALVFQMRAVPKTRLTERIPRLTDAEIGEFATDEAVGRIEPEEA